MSVIKPKSLQSMFLNPYQLSLCLNYFVFRVCDWICRVAQQALWTQPGVVRLCIREIGEWVRYQNYPSTTHSVPLAITVARISLRCLFRLQNRVTIYGCLPCYYNWCSFCNHLLSFNPELTRLNFIIEHCISISTRLFLFLVSLKYDFIIISLLGTALLSLFSKKVFLAYISTVASQIRSGRNGLYIAVLSLNWTKRLACV